MITSNSLPAWTGTGILPPVRPGFPGHSTERSPYLVDLVSFTERFSTSPERARILDGLLRFRAALQRAGIITGFQWIDGSFLENIEILEGRPPHDIDVVTFFNLPDGETQKSFAAKAPDLFNHEFIKTTYSIDSYTFVLGKHLDSSQIKEVVYWYSMWSHRRNGAWKGFVQIDLDHSRDPAAKLALSVNGGNHE